MPSLMYLKLHAKAARAREHRSQATGDDLELAKAGAPIVDDNILSGDGASGSGKVHPLRAAWVHWSLFSLGVVCTVFATVLIIVNKIDPGLMG